MGHLERIQTVPVKFFVVDTESPYLLPLQITAKLRSFSVRTYLDSFFCQEHSCGVKDICCVCRVVVSIL